jgi:putative membrane-bound dehydrogenase-like protein
MHHRFSRRAAAAGGLAAIMTVSGFVTPEAAANDDPTSTADEASDAFGLTSLWKIHLEIAAEEYEAMQPAAPAFGGPPPVPRRDGARPVERNLFGTEFPWAEANLSLDGTVFEKVGIRYAGDVTYFVSAAGLKRPFKVQLDRFGGERPDGRSTFQLHSMPLDPAKAREAIAMAVFRLAGVPAPRTAFAEVTLTVPGRHDDALLGLYTVVEGVDGRFLAEHFGSDEGLLMQPFGLRGVDYLGDDWSRYVGAYRPHRAATPAEVRRVIAFARLVNESTSEEFQEQIGSFIDVDAFLTFMAANALTSNLESFLALGHNYFLYLDPATGLFSFLPGDLEFSLANFLLMGSPEQLMDLSLLQPYPGENRLPDRLLAIDAMRTKYRALLARLAESVFTREQLARDAAAALEAIEPAREREAAAVAARREPPPGFGGPPMGPQPPDLATFAQKRGESVAAQLAGAATGFIPQPFNFGPPRQGSSEPIDEDAFAENVRVPRGFEATLFAAPPVVNYPVAIAAAPTGEVFVAIDEQGSLGRTPGGGKIVRCIDIDDDGRVDDVVEYASVDHPRGLCYRRGSLWVMHPPTLSVFHDDDLDGTADRHEVLVTGLTTEMLTSRGGDHTTNCVRMGIDGWLYIGVGDYGILEARGTDGRTITQRGGGIVRVRPDGTELEVYCTGLRNPFDVAIDPLLNLFTRDNTNDGAGWDVRVSHLVQSAEYGYPRLYANFTDEIMPALGSFGGGGGTGGLYVDHPSWPDRYRNIVFTGDWGRSEVYRDALVPSGATFELEEDVFMTMPRATGMDVDGSGRMYVASWLGGEASVYVGTNVGFVARVTPPEFQSITFPDLTGATLEELSQHLAAPSAITRLHAQGEMLDRGRDPRTTHALLSLASNPELALEPRVAAIFTLKQLDGADANASIAQLASDAAVRDFALRTLTDRTTQLEAVDAALFVAALADESPRVRAQALVSLGRLGDLAAASAIIPLARRATEASRTAAPFASRPDPDLVIPHLAVRTLVALGAVEACLAAVDGPEWQGALAALRSMHDPRAAEGLITKLRTTRDVVVRREILTTLIRLYHHEADYDGSWWGIRPDSTGPYYDGVEWEASRRIGEVLTTAFLDADAETAEHLEREFARHQVELAGLPRATTTAARVAEDPIVIPRADPANADQIGNLTIEAAARRALAASGDAGRGELLFKAQSCLACHTTADGQAPKGPHLVDIGRRYKAGELVESILQPSAKLAQGYESYLFVMADGRSHTGFVVGERAAATVIREATGVQRVLDRGDIESREQQVQSAMPEGIVANLTPEQLADLVAYLQTLE